MMTTLAKSRAFSTLTIRKTKRRSRQMARTMTKSSQFQVKKMMKLSVRWILIRKSSLLVNSRRHHSSKSHRRWIITKGGSPKNFITRRLASLICVSKVPRKVEGRCNWVRIRITERATLHKKSRDKQVIAIHQVIEVDALLETSPKVWWLKRHRIL